MLRVSYINGWLRDWDIYIRCEVNKLVNKRMVQNLPTTTISVISYLWMLVTEECFIKDKVKLRGLNNGGLDGVYHRLPFTSREEVGCENSIFSILQASGNLSSLSNKLS